MSLVTIRQLRYFHPRDSTETNSRHQLEFHRRIGYGARRQAGETKCRRERVSRERKKKSLGRLAAGRCPRCPTHRFRLHWRTYPCYRPPSPPAAWISTADKPKDEHHVAARVCTILHAWEVGTALPTHIRSPQVERPTTSPRPSAPSEYRYHRLPRQHRHRPIRDTLGIRLRWGERPLRPNINSISFWVCGPAWQGVAVVQLKEARGFVCSHERRRGRSRGCRCAF